MIKAIAGKGNDSVIIRVKAINTIINILKPAKESPDGAGIK